MREADHAQSQMHSEGISPDLEGSFQYEYGGILCSEAATVASLHL